MELTSDDFKHNELMEKIGTKKEYTFKCRKMITRISELIDELRTVSVLKRKNYINTKIIDLKASSDNGKEFC